jgi:hypothetical protein
VDEHTPSSFHDTGSQGYDEGHVGVHGIADQYLTRFECEEVGGFENNAGLSESNPGPCGLTDDLPGFDMKILFLRVFIISCVSGDPRSVPKTLSMRLLPSERAFRI